METKDINPRCSVTIVYEGEGAPHATFVGISKNKRLLIQAKRQMVKEATEALQAAEEVGDEVLIAEISGTRKKLQDTLDLLIPSEIESFYLVVGDVEV